MFKFKILSIILFFFPFTSLFGQQLNEHSYISVLSCGSGNELYSTFGHTALRICDTSQNMDIVFNYGTFDFNTPGFYVKFSQGRLPYMLSVTSFENFVSDYAYEGRWVYEQRLHLTAAEKDKMYQLLIENYQPENRYYAYDFFMDNCATRVRDIIEKSLIDRNFFADTLSPDPATFRTLIYPYLDSMLWWRLGIDLILGIRCDHQATTYQYMFLPYELMNQLDSIQYEGKPVIEKSRFILPETRIIPDKGISPTLIAWFFALFILIITLIEYKKKIHIKTLDIILWTSISLLSLLVAYLWFCSNHYTTKYNLNLLWANPLAIYLLIRLRKSKPVILYIYMVCTIAVLCFFWLLPQNFNATVFPLVIVVLLRLLRLIPSVRKYFEKD